MLFMVIERFSDLAAVGARFREHGRLMPESVTYHASWMDTKGRCCYQVMEAPDRQSLEEWMRNWEDLVEFEVSEVLTSSEFWTPRRPVSTIFDLVMGYSIPPSKDVRSNISEALREARTDAS